MVMRAKENTYHLECFACQRCSHRFCVGDKFYLLDNRVLCEYDYEEEMGRRLNMQSLPSPILQQQPKHYCEDSPGSQSRGSSVYENQGSPDYMRQQYMPQPPPLKPQNGARVPGSNINSNNWCSSLDKLEKQTASLKTEVINWTHSME
jgi:hypothetical protein